MTQARGRRPEDAGSRTTARDLRPPRAGAREPHRCASCGAAVEARFCGACGERRLAPGGERVGELVRTWLAEYVGADGRLWRTLHALLLRPGLLTAEYLRGARRRWLRPLQLFVLANVVYFALQPFTAYQAFYSSLDAQTERQVYSGLLVPHVRARVAADARALEAVGVAPDEALRRAREQLDARYDASTRVLSKLLLVLLVPLFAVGIALLAPRLGPVPWLVLATHWAAFDLLGVNLVLGGAMRALPPLAALVRAASLGELLPTTLIGLWGALALRRLTGRGRLATAATAVLLAVWFVVCAIGYRLLLFWATWLGPLDG